MNRPFYFCDHVKRRSLPERLHDIIEASREHHYITPILRRTNIGNDYKFLLQAAYTNMMLTRKFNYNKNATAKDNRYTDYIEPTEWGLDYATKVRETWNPLLKHLNMKLPNI